MKAAVIVFPGSNCDRDMKVALAASMGADPLMIWHKETSLPKVDLIVVPGGFSFGDYLRCGAMAAKSPIMQSVVKQASAGLPTLGICNGFQVLTETGLLPGALMQNAGLKFICKDVTLRVETTETLFTRQYTKGQVVQIPIAHNEGNYFTDTDTLKMLKDQNRIAFRYCGDDGKTDASSNPNGSIDNIAGVLNESGTVLGMMPHPERLADPLLGGLDGKPMFDGLIEVLAYMPNTQNLITPDVVQQHGLSNDEYKLVLEIMGREPNLTELGILSVMWSEHCSYKSSKKWLKTLPTEAPWVICGPGENAGIIDIGDNQAVIFKMESHNHPSFIEPYQGAATGVGGIMRDVFTMGARPIANMNALRFGAPDHPKTKHLVAGVVAGIGGYGNCMGIPTVGGECTFHPSYNGNILVNAMTVGLADADNIFYATAAGIGNPVIYVGSKTGRDGIHGATMASAEFNEDSEEKRATVQVGDPFTEKLLLEACLELMKTNAIVAIQDMGAAGLTSSSFEMASKGDMGVEMNLDQVPIREDGMTAYEMMLSESQERMLMVLKPGSEDMAREIYEKWDLDFAVVGHLTDTGRMVLKMNNDVVGDLPIQPLADSSPEYDRPWTPTPKREGIKPEDLSLPLDLNAALRTLVSSPEIASKRWIWEQYDHMVMADTLGIGRPGGDAAIVRVHDTDKALAISTDCTPRYCYADPIEGGKQAVAETWRNLTAVGAKPLAITDCMNFGNPERPEIMGQFVGCIKGMREACTVLDYPVVSGNVSFYNETNGQGILPTPAIGGVGLIDHVEQSCSLAFKADNETVIVIGNTHGHLGMSIYLREITHREDGAPPPVDLALEKKNGDLVRDLIHNGMVTACHDIADGGLGVALAEMAMAGNRGVQIEHPETGIPLFAWLFGEDQGRYLLTTAEPGKVIKAAKKMGVDAHILGKTGTERLTVGDEIAISVSELRSLHENWLPDYMASP